MRISADVHVVRPDFTLAVEFEIDGGTTLAVVGPNGSGKSTLIDVLAGHTPLTKGSIRFDDTMVDEPSSDTFVSPEDRPVALVHQEPLLFPHLTVQANVEFGLRAGKVTAADRHARAADALAAVGLSGFASSKPQELSGGQAQRASLARALVLRRPIVLLDEPLSKVDVGNRRTIRQSLGEPGQTQVVVTHGPDHVRECDLVLAMDHGRPVAFAPPAEVAADPPTPWLAELFT